MITFSTTAFVPNAVKEQVTDFFIHCTVPLYQEWWPGVHLEMYTMKRTAGVLGSIVYFDEYVGKRRLKFRSRITRYERGKILEYQLIKIFPLPAWLVMEFSDTGNGVSVVHTLKAGCAGKVLDPFLKIYLSDSFGKDLRAHAEEEFLRLGRMLAEQQQK